MNGSCAACVLSCAHNAAFHSSEARTTRSSETSSAAIAAEIGLAVNAEDEDDEEDTDAAAVADADGEKANVADAEAGDAFGRSSECEATIDRPISVKINDKKACSGADNDNDAAECCIASTFESEI